MSAERRAPVRFALSVHLRQHGCAAQPQGRTHHGCKRAADQSLGTTVTDVMFGDGIARGKAGGRGGRGGDAGESRRPRGQVHMWSVPEGFVVADEPTALSEEANAHTSSSFFSLNTRGL